MSTVMLMVGMPGSGKTTAAKAIVSSNSRWARISRDDLRDMMFDGFKRKREKELRDPVKVMEKAINNLKDTMEGEDAQS